MEEEQTLEAQTEVVEEQVVEEKAEVAEPVSETEQVSEKPEEPTGAPDTETLPETPVSEAETPVDEVTAKEKLAQEVKQRLLTCAEDSHCLDALTVRFEEVARRLGVPADKLIDEVFALFTRQEG